MSFIPEESKKEKEMRERLESAGVLKSESKKRAEGRKEKEERSRKDYEQKQKTLEYKRERLEWQKERSKIKDKLRKEAEEKRKKRELAGTSDIKMEPISDKDRDPTAYKKAMSGVASYGKAVLGAGARAVIAAAKNRKKKAPQFSSVKNISSPTQKLLPGSKDKKMLPPAKPPVGSLEPSSGQRARMDPAFKKREIEKRGGTTSEQFSCWREDFLYEINDMKKRKKRKDEEDKIIDVMPKNKTNRVTVGPVVNEEILNERKRDHLANAVLATSFALGVAQSPQALVRSGHIEGPGMQLMDKMMRKRKEANRNLDHGRIVPRNKKKENDVNEALDKKILLAAIVKKLIDEKKRKNSLINNKYIGESKYSKSNLECNKPKSDPVGSGETGKSHVVKACEGGKEKLIRFGQRGVKGSPKKEGESASYASRRERFKARHAKNIAKGKMSAAYWADKVKW